MMPRAKYEDYGLKIMVKVEGRVQGCHDYQDHSLHTAPRLSIIITATEMLYVITTQIGRQRISEFVTQWPQAKRKLDSD